MAFKGDFDTFFISNILQLLSDENKTGILQLTDGKKRVEIIIKEGSIIYALGAKLEFKLGSILKNKNIINTEQLENALKEGKEKNLALGTILVQQGLVSEDTLKEYIRHQVEEIIYDVFLWETGEFEYKNTKLNLDRVIVTHLDVTRILIEASRRIDEMAIFKKHIPNEEIVFRIKGNINVTEKIKPSQKEAQVISLIDGQKNITQLMAISHLDQFTLYKALYSLISSGVIETCMIDPSGQALYSSIIKAYYDILHIIFKNIQQQVGEKAAHIFKENKPIIEPKEKNVIKNFDQEISVSENTDFILSEMKNFNNIEEGFAVLGNAFNMYILNILEIIPTIIGIEQTKILLRDIGLILLYIGRVQCIPDDKFKIVSDIEYIIQKVNKNLNEK